MFGGAEAGGRARPAGLHGRYLGDGVAWNTRAHDTTKCGARINRGGSCGSGDRNGVQRRRRARKKDRNLSPHS